MQLSDCGLYEKSTDVYLWDEKKPRFVRIKIILSQKMFFLMIADGAGGSFFLCAIAFFVCGKTVFRECFEKTGLNFKQKSHRITQILTVLAKIKSLGFDAISCSAKTPANIQHHHCLRRNARDPCKKPNNTQWPH